MGSFVNIAKSSKLSRAINARLNSRLVRDGTRVCRSVMSMHGWGNLRLTSCNGDSCDNGGRATTLGKYDGTV